MGSGVLGCWMDLVEASAHATAEIGDPTQTPDVLGEACGGVQTSPRQVVNQHFLRKQEWTKERKRNYLLHLLCPYFRGCYVNMVLELWGRASGIAAEGPGRGLCFDFHSGQALCDTC